MTQHSTKYNIYRIILQGVHMISKMTAMSNIGLS